MPPASTAEATFRRHEKIVANVDMPGVPAGTPGKVLLVDGITWRRYRVLFANGVDRGSLDRRHLVRPREFVPLDQRVVEEVVADAATHDGAAADDGATAAADNRFGVPAHLIERSRRARERLAAAG
ncbi:MAG: hypothetical protein AB7L84_08855 [Acidimicrobiia bacterium]